MFPEKSFMNCLLVVALKICFKVIFFVLVVKEIVFRKKLRNSSQKEKKKKRKNEEIYGNLGVIFGSATGNLSPLVGRG